MEVRIPPPWPPAEPEKSFSEAVRDLRTKTGVHLAEKGPVFDTKTCKLVPAIEDIKVASQAYNSLNSKLDMLEREEELDKDTVELLKGAASDVWVAGRSEIVRLLKTECSCRIDKHK